MSPGKGLIFLPRVGSLIRTVRTTWIICYAAVKSKTFQLLRVFRFVQKRDSL